MDIFDAAGMREADRLTIEEGGLPGVTLMETAGRMAADHLLRVLPQAKGGALVVCGKGNNGGDGFVLARYLLGRGIPTRVLRLFKEDDASGDGAIHMDIARRAGVLFQEVLTLDALANAFRDTPPHWVRVDAILGTGLRSEVRGLYKAAIHLLYDGSAPVFALDLPSGVHPDTGACLGVAPKATATATFGGLKLGLTIEPGASAAGDVEVMDIGLMGSLIGHLPIGHALSHSIVQGLLQPLGTQSHKGSHGHLLIIAGSAGKGGAAALCAGAALRSGVGLVTLATPRGALARGALVPPEIMVEAYPGDGQGQFGPGDCQSIIELAAGKSAIAIGPGLGVGEGAQTILEAILHLDHPCVIDADGLNIISQNEGLRATGARAVLTPHPGELGRLQGVSSQAIQADRVARAKAMAGESGSVVLLKGARTVIAHPGGPIDINPTGNPGMATGGTGDVLTGLIGGLLAQGLAPGDAARCGAYLHGLSGDLIKARSGARSLVAGDLIHNLGAAFQDVLGEEA